MTDSKELRISKRAFLLFVLISFTSVSFSQNYDSTKVYGHFGGAVTITNKGISLIPNLTLGKPAAIFDMSVGGKRLSFEPQFRFALEGKPWTFILWWRYKLVRKEKFQLNIGAHPAFAFKTVTITSEGESQEIIRASHFLAGEIVPSYSVSDKINLSIYYLNAHGLEEDLTQSTNYLALRCNFSNIRISEQFFLKFNPQVYYLKMDADDGFYANASLTLARRNFPLSVSSLFNKTIKTEIPVGEDFIWNVSLIYSFNNEYVRR
jgi:hypothetical protein